MCRAAEALTDEQREAMAASSFPSLTAKTPPNTDFTRFLREVTA